MCINKNCRLMSLLLALALLLCACGNENTAEGTAASPSEEPTEITLPTYETVDNPVHFFSLSLGEDYEKICRMDVFMNDDGTAHVEYVGTEKKVAELDANIFHGITAAFLTSGLGELNGQESYAEGDANGSMYVDFTDGTVITAGYGGNIPESFRNGFAKMDAFFVEMLASVPVYVPQPQIIGQVDAALLNPVMEILNHSGIEALDSFTVSQAEKDEYFAFTLGLSSGDGIAAGVTCAPMMMTTAFSLVIVTLEDGTDAQTVCKDFEETLDWRKWVCVAPSNAMIAQKGNQVLCLMASGPLYAGIANGAQQTGWTEVKTLKNPNV